MPIETVAIVGGGPAGLATAACLRFKGLDALVLDAGSEVGESWASRYERLHLHTPRIQSHLPGRRIPRSMGRWVAKDDYATYLRDYAAHHGLRIAHSRNVTRIDRDAEGLHHISTNGGPIESRIVVLATGYNQTPKIPDWPGLETYDGRFMHASKYRTGADHRGLDVLVVGSGNTGAEICADLCEQGAARVRMSVRTPPNVIPREIGPIPTTLLGIANDYLPVQVADPLNRLIQKVTLGDLRPHGLQPAPGGVVAQMRRTDVVPTIDVGMVEQLRAGRIEVVTEVTGFGERSVELSDGTEIEPDIVIAATGYHRSIDTLVGHLGVLEDGRPTVGGGTTHPSDPSMYFVGLSNPLKGLLLQINLDARAAAKAIQAAIR
jgi:cation diffusion facilitator CzcD-associated flavoprotein CzcO